MGGGRATDAPSLPGASRTARTTGRRVSPLASGPAMMGGLAGRSRSCPRGHSTRSGNLRSGEEEDVRAGSWSRGAKKVGTSRSGDPAGLGAGRRLRKTWSCSLPAHPPFSGSQLWRWVSEPPLIFSPAFALLYLPLHFTIETEGSLPRCHPLLAKPARTWPLDRAHSPP
jgi:hypothetical protein